MKSEHGHDEARDDDVERGRLERIVPEIVKRILEAGYEKISEGPENVRRVVGDLKLPKEVLLAVLAQLDETKSGLYRVVAREIRDFLGRTSIAEELSRALTALSFEIRTEVRFVPNPAGERRSPEVRAKVGVRRRDEKPPTVQPAETESSHPTEPPESDPHGKKDEE